MKLSLLFPTVTLLEALILGFFAMPGLSETARSASGQLRPTAPVSFAISAKSGGIQPKPVGNVSIPTGRQAQIDLGGMGGLLYSTGLEDIWVRIIPKVRGRDMTYDSDIYLLSPGPRRYLGLNYDSKQLGLGRLPAGEIQIGVYCDTYKVNLQTGPGERNPDGVPHATVRALSTEMIEVRFEDSPGLPEKKLVNGNLAEKEWARKNYFGDVILQFSGGVTADPAVLALLKSLKDPNPDVRKNAAYVLKQAYPRIARTALR